MLTPFPQIFENINKYVERVVDYQFIVHVECLK